MSEFSESEIIKGVIESLPAGWTMREAAVGSGCDAVAESPDGTIFPIDIRPGAGYLDISTVTRFGRTVQETADSGEIGDLLSVEEQATVDPLAIKPVIITSRELPEASSEYASMFRIGVVQANPAEIADQLESWNDTIVQAGTATAAPSGSPPPLLDWFELGHSPTGESDR